MATMSDGRTALSQQASGTTSEEHAQRIKQELAAVGVTRFGLRKFAAHYLHHVIHPYEHIMAVVYGRYGSGGFFTRFNEGMLIATDRRVIFLDYKPGFMDMKELTYEVVSGVERTTAAIFSAITLYTKIGDYTLRYANSHCVEQFMEYIEHRRLETENRGTAPLAGVNASMVPKVQT